MGDGEVIHWDVNEDLVEIFSAAQNPTIHELSEPIVKKIKEKIKADNIRIRFVDHTGEKLVPEEISGSCEDDQMMAVRSFDQCVVGRAARRMKAQRVSNLQDNLFFQNFLNEVKTRGREGNNRAKWKHYANTLKDLQSEIAVPIIMGKMLNPHDTEDGTGTKKIRGVSKREKDLLIGVINANSKGGPFSEVDEKTLIKFGFYLSLAVFTRRSVLLEKLRDIELEMMSLYDRNAVAHKIAECVQIFFKGSIPNIYLYDKEREGNPFQFIAAAGTKEEKKLGEFAPRWGGPNPGLGETVIKTWENHEDAFRVIEDVEHDPLAGAHARQEGVKTVCCVPLAFQGEIVGLLYLHFQDKIHFFTREDKKILELFAHSAAIAIRNVTGSPSSFADLYGKEMLEHIDKYPVDQDNTVLVKLKKISKDLKNSRGRKEIVPTIVNGMSEIGRTLRMPEELFRIFSQFQKYEELILFNIPRYRDHFIHMFFVFSTGFLIINDWKRKKIHFVKSDADYQNWIRNWFICATMHDVAYPVSDVEKWVPNFPTDTLGLPYRIRASFDWSPFVVSAGSNIAIGKISSRFAQVYHRAKTGEDIFRQWFYKGLLEIHDHGALGALAIMNLKWDPSLQKNAVDAALAVSLHNYVKDKETPLEQLKITDFPLAVLLTYCDVVQEWGRLSGDVNADKPLKEIQRRVFFKDLVIEKAGKNSTTIFLLYSPEKDLDDEEMQKNGQIIAQKFADNITVYTPKWSCAQLNHTFKIAVWDKKREICHYRIL
jgi:hypothetical protein